MAVINPSSIRNFAIIAHIDHGKTTLVDAMLAQSGIFQAHQDRPDRVMDSFDQERERGITILAKNTAVFYGDTKLNILDTPGHADFGGEVERVMTLADGAILLVDAAEGPLPQTRFVLQKAMAANLKIIVVINKIDRGDARAAEVLDEVYDLFIDLGADEGDLDFPVLYAIGRDGVAKRALDDPSDNLKPLFETILNEIPSPKVAPEAPFRMRVANTEYDDYVGRLAVGCVESGSVKLNQAVHVFSREGKKQGRLVRLYSFRGLAREEQSEIGAGDIVALAGLESVEIGDTISTDPEATPLPRIEVDPPTIRMTVHVNDSPFAGREGKYVTSRQLGARLRKAAEQNVAIRVEQGAAPDQFDVAGRGELQLAVLVEEMRREGYELAMSRPEAVVREEDGVRLEPYERLTVDVPSDFIGDVSENLSGRRGKMLDMQHHGDRVRMVFLIPSRGLIGFRGEFLTMTRGQGVNSSVVDSWAPEEGVIAGRKNGALVSDRVGKTTPYAIFNLQPRGRLFIPPGTEVYEGMIVGEHARENDLDVNICREKKLTNIRAAGKDENVILSPAKVLTLESAMEFIDEDELMEVTPNSIRLRKRVLAANIRPKRGAERRVDSA